MKSLATGITQREGESDEEFYERVRKWFLDDGVKSKGDNREWTGSFTFHLNREG